MLVLRVLFAQLGKRNDLMRAKSINFQFKDFQTNDKEFGPNKIFFVEVVRYVDLMESSIAQSIHKGFEKEKWEIKG